MRMNPEIRKSMIAFRERVGATMRDMAKFAECSYTIIYGVERLGWITHPRIAARIAHAYKIGVDGYNDLVHKDHRADVLPERVGAPKTVDWVKYAKQNRISYGHDYRNE